MSELKEDGSKSDHIIFSCTHSRMFIVGAGVIFVHFLIVLIAPPHVHYVNQISLELLCSLFSNML